MKTETKAKSAISKLDPFVTSFVENNSYESLGLFFELLCVTHFLQIIFEIFDYIFYKYVCLNNIIKIFLDCEISYINLCKFEVFTNVRI